VLSDLSGYWFSGCGIDAGVVGVLGHATECDVLVCVSWMSVCGGCIMYWGWGVVCCVCGLCVVWL
jgi:hypothetical protein